MTMTTTVIIHTERTGAVAVPHDVFAFLLQCAEVGCDGYEADPGSEADKLADKVWALLEELRA